jgi:hypothetical protein
MLMEEDNLAVEMPSPKKVEQRLTLLFENDAPAKRGYAPFNSVLVDREPVNLNVRFEQSWLQVQRL